MASQRGRTDPEPVDEEDEATPPPLDSSLDRFRARVKRYTANAQFPQAPLYDKGEEVWIVDGSQVQGPFEVVSSDAGNKYTLKHKTTGQQRSGVREDLLQELKRP